MSKRGQIIYYFSTYRGYQNYPQSLLPEALKDENPFNILRLVNGEMTRNKIWYEKLTKKKRPVNSLFFYCIYY